MQIQVGHVYFSLLSIFFTFLFVQMSWLAKQFKIERTLTLLGICESGSVFMDHTNDGMLSYANWRPTPREQRRRLKWTSEAAAYSRDSEQRLLGTGHDSTCQSPPKRPSWVLVPNAQTQKTQERCGGSQRHHPARKLHGLWRSVMTQTTSPKPGSRRIRVISYP